tara:strand:- start:270 stop:671 length:402 start_codon:yes stop_codon:yes gene_type:complete
MSGNDNLVRDFLNRCNIVFTEFSQLEGMNIPRETLLSNEVYDKVKGDIGKIKKFYSSGSMTSLQKNAETVQKWPLLNLVRQILKTNNYVMHPIRKSNGYAKDGKKKYLRFFLIKRIKSIKPVDTKDIVIQEIA